MLQQVLQFADDLGADSLDIRVYFPKDGGSRRVMVRASRSSHQAMVEVTEEVVRTSTADVLIDSEARSMLKRQFR